MLTCTLACQSLLQACHGAFFRLSPLEQRVLELHQLCLTQANLDSLCHQFLHNCILLRAFGQANIDQAVSFACFIMPGLDICLFCSFGGFDPPKAGRLDPCLLWSLFPRLFRSHCWLFLCWATSGCSRPLAGWLLECSGRNAARAGG